MNSSSVPNHYNMVGETSQGDMTSGVSSVKLAMCERCQPRAPMQQLRDCDATAR